MIGYVVQGHMAIKVNMLQRIDIFYIDTNEKVTIDTRI